MNDTTGRLRDGLRSGVVLAATALALSACAAGDDPAASNALGYEDGAGPPSEGISTLEVLALYVLIPLAIMLLLAALVWLPGMVRGSNRYRPNKGWGAAPLWFGGPADPAAAVETAETGDLVRGGASGGW